MTDFDVQHLSEMLKTNITLAHLALRSNDISDGGVQVLANTLTHHNNTLQGLYLEENKLITDLSVNPLVQMLKQNGSLKILRVSDCQLSRKEKERLRQMKKSKKDLFLVV
jgi:Ran GTPase-activating protein (RanGAP) involved in mRNA processing and transport